MTEDQLRETCYQVFQLIDANNNGTLDEDELRAFFRNTIQKHQPSRTFSEQEFRTNWNKMDKNSDNKIDFDEFWRFLHAKAIVNGTL